MADNEVLTEQHAVKFASEVEGEDTFYFDASLTPYPKELGISFATPDKILGKFLLSKVGQALKIKEDGFDVPNSNNLVKIFNRVIGMYLPTVNPAE